MLLHVQVGRTNQRGKNVGYCLDGVRGLGIRSSLLYCFEEKRRQDVGDLKEVFPIGPYVCSDCSNIVEEYPKFRETCQYAERLLSNTATISSQMRALLPEQGPHFPCRRQSC